MLLLAIAAACGAGELLNCRVPTMTEVLPAGGAERGEGAVMAGWLDKRAGEWEFWHRYWAELRRDSLTFFTAEDPEHTLDADHLEWHAQRRLDLARCFSLPASAGGDDDAGGGHFAIRAPHVPTGCVRLRCGSESELREWLRNLDELLQPEPEPEPEAEAAPELAASPGKFAFKLPGTSSTAGSTPAFNFKPFVFQPRVDSGPADAAPTEPPQPPARAAGLAANPEPEPEPEPEPTGGTDGGGLFRFSLPFASQAKAGEEQSGAGPGPGLSEPQGFAFHGFFGEKKESGTTLPPPSLASALPAFGLGAGSSAPAFAAAAHKGEGVDQDRLGRLMARQAASQPAAFPGSAPAFAFREPAKGAPGSGSAASAASGFSFGGAGGYPSSQPRAFGRPAGSAPATVRMKRHFRAAKQSLSQLLS